MVARATRKIICVAQGTGREHDFNLYKATIGAAVHPDILLQADSGYQACLPAGRG